MMWENPLTPRHTIASSMGVASPAYVKSFSVETGALFHKLARVQILTWVQILTHLFLIAYLCTIDEHRRIETAIERT